MKKRKLEKPEQAYNIILPLKDQRYPNNYSANLYVVFQYSPITIRINTYSFRPELALSICQNVKIKSLGYLE